MCSVVPQSAGPSPVWWPSPVLSDFSRQHVQFPEGGTEAQFHELTNVFGTTWLLRRQRGIRIHIAFLQILLPYLLAAWLWESK